MVPGALRQRAETRIEWPHQPSLGVDIGIAGAYAWADNPDATAQTRPLPTDDGSAATLVTELIGRITRRSHQPDFVNLVDETTWDDYVRTALRDACRSAVRPAHG